MPQVLYLLSEHTARTYVFAALDTLEFLRRSGRMNGVIAGIGSLLQIKPLLTMNRGEPGAEKVRTKERAIQRLIQLVKDVGPLERIDLVHTNAPQAAEALWQRVRSIVPDIPKPLLVNVTPVLGTHLGPGVIGFALIQAAASEQ
jgi:DegV family protein with EDD domain